jgi:ribosomal protein S24E
LKISIVSTKINPMLKRREIRFRLEEDLTPSRTDVRREITVLEKTDLEKVWIRELITKKGTNVTLGLAHIYDEAAIALKMEPEHIIQRHTKS